MKTIIVLAAVLAVSSAAFARGGGGHGASGHGSYSSGYESSGSHSTSGYTKSNGTYVAPSHATNPNGTKADNWSTRGNANPYTGKPGTKPRD